MRGYWGRCSPVGAEDPSIVEKPVLWDVHHKWKGQWRERTLSEARRQFVCAVEDRAGEGTQSLGVGGAQKIVSGSLTLGCWNCFALIVRKG